MSRPTHPASPEECAAACPLADAVVGRRQFLSTAVVAAAAAALAACGVGTTEPGGSVSTNVPSGSTVRVSDYAALAATGGVALVSLGGVPVAVVRTGESSFVALSRICPHQGTVVNQSSTGFLCPRHGARFSATGAWLGGERTSSMRAFQTSYDAVTGMLTVG